MYIDIYIYMYIYMYIYIYKPSSFWGIPPLMEIQKLENEATLHRVEKCRGVGKGTHWPIGGRARSNGFNIGKRCMRYSMFVGFYVSCMLYNCIIHYTYIYIYIYTHVLLCLLYVRKEVDTIDESNWIFAIVNLYEVPRLNRVTPRPPI